MIGSTNAKSGNMSGLYMRIGSCSTGRYTSSSTFNIADMYSGYASLTTSNFRFLMTSASTSAASPYGGYDYTSCTVTGRYGFSYNANDGMLTVSLYGDYEDHNPRVTAISGDVFMVIP